MDSGRRVAIIGAGAWGLSAALALAETGTASVEVFERERPGGGATSLAAGLVSTHLRQESDIRLVLDTQRRLQRLRAWGKTAERPSADHAYSADGSLTVVATAQADRLHRLADRIRSAGGRSEFVDGHEIARRWPLKDAHDLFGIFSPDDGHVEAGDLVDLLHARLRALGVPVRVERAAGLDARDGRCVGVLTAEGPQRFDDVVLAAGAWSKRIAQDAALRLPLKAYRTQVAQVEYPHQGTFPIFHDTLLYVYARPDGENHLLIGDGTEFVESQPDAYNRNVDASFVEKIASAASQRLRGGDQAGYRRGWSGLCVSTPDRDPLIGAYPGVAGLHLLCGDNGFGVMRSLALGAIAADRVMGRRDAAPTLYRPDRVAMDADFPIREGFEL
jgi:sarcosine oxidase subunit beta